MAESDGLGSPELLGLKRLPTHERYGLIAQIHRAAVPVPTNIAEGQGRRHLSDYLHHLSIANGSLKELETHFLIAERLQMLANEVGRMLRGLGDELRRRSNSGVML